MSHPYSGADNFPSSITLNDDGVDAPSMTNFNTPSEGLGDRTAYVFKRARSLNWQQSYLPNPTGGGPIVTVCCTGYDTLTQKWLIGGHPTSAGDAISQGYGDPSGWVMLPTLLSGPLASGVFRSIIRGNEPSLSPASKYIYASYVISGSPLVIMRIDTNASSAASQPTPTGTHTNVVDCQLVTIPGVIVTAISATAAAQSNLSYSTNSGNSWTAQIALTISAAIPYWLIAVNPSNQIVAIPGQTQPSYITSTNGTSWTLQAGLNGIGAGETPTTLCWADDGTGLGCWIFSTVGTGGSSGVIKLYLSYDGVNWTNFANDLPNVPSGFFYMSNMSDARVLVGVFDENPARVVCSLNGGGHWLTCRTEAPLPTTVSSYPTSSKLISGPNQTALAAGALLFLSDAIGDPGGVGQQ